MHGIFLFEDPIPLYRCEKAQLYIGFSARVNLKEKDEAVVEFTPQAYVRESVFDYNLRRERGASANAIARNLITYRNRTHVKTIKPMVNLESTNDPDTLNQAQE